MRSIETICKKHERLLFFSILLLFLANAAIGLNKFLILDEWLYVKASEAILKTGFPVYASNIFNPVYPALWHPPLALFFYAGAFRLMGISEFSARLVPLLFSAGTLALTYLLCKRLFRNQKNPEAIALLSIFLYAINPFTVQNALLVDIDGGALTFFMTLFIYLFITLDARYRRPVLIIAFALSMFTKLVSPAASLAGVFLLSIHTRDRKRTADAAISGIGGILISISLLYAYTLLSGWPSYFSMPFGHSFNSVGLFSRATYPLQVLATAKTLLLYLTPPFTLLALLGLVHAAYPISKLKANKELSLFIAWTAPILALYGILGHMTWFFPKYFMPAMPALAILTANYLISIRTGIRGTMAAAGILATLLYSLLVIKTPHFEIFKPNLILNAVYPLLYSLPIGFGYYAMRALKKPFLEKLAIGSFLAFIPLALYLNIALNTSNYSSAFLYGTAGVKETGIFLKTHTQEGDIILAPEDVAYYAGRSHYSFVSFDKSRSAELTGLIKNKKARYITIYPYFLDSETEALILKTYTHETDIGSFPIYSPQ